MSNPNPKKQPITLREGLIARRIREVREKLRMTRDDFAAQLAIKTERLASYEDARVAIRFLIALRLCRQFCVSERWLATGQVSASGDEVPFLFKGTRNCMSLELEPESREILAETPFSDAYDSVLSARYTNLEKLHPFYPRIIVTYADFVTLTTNALVAITQDSIRDLMMPMKVPFANSLIDAAVLLTWELSQRGYQGSELAAAIARAGERCQLEMVGAATGLNLTRGQEEKELTTPSELRKSPSEMKLTLKGILDDVRRITKPTGMKAKLADDLKVPQARVSEWLSGKHEPSGEMTLQLFNWVQRQMK